MAEENTERVELRRIHWSECFGFVALFRTFRLSLHLSKLGLAFIPSVGNFICVDVGQDPTLVYQALLREGVIVRPVDNYGLPGYLRISIGLPEENQRLLQALGGVLAA